MAIYPKDTKDQLSATDWNTAAALATTALQPAGNLAGLTDTAAARANLDLAAVAGTGDFDDLTGSPLVTRSDVTGHYVVDEYGDIAEKITDDGTRHIARANITVLDIAGGSVADNASATDALAFVDPYGNMAGAVGTDGQWKFPGISVSAAPAGYSLVVADRYGNIAGYLDEAGVPHGIFGGGGSSTGSSGSSYSAEEQARRGAAALATAALVANETNTTAARPVWKYNHVLAYGQSLSTGWESWPRLSTAQPHDNLMIGDSDHPASETSSAWVQIGTAAFNALVATVESGGSLASDVAVAAYSAGNTARGESPIVGAVNFWRRQQLNARGLASDSSRLLVASSCGVGGKTIAELAYGASPNLFNRMIDAVEICETLATAASATFGVPAVLFLQGENDASNGSTDKDTYKAALLQWQADVTTHVAGVASQSAPPCIFSYQTSGSYVRDTNSLAVSRAQLEAAQEFRDWYCVGPAYPYTDKSGHLDPNGSRWLGMQFGKVMHRVLDLGQGWMPVHPLRATYRGTQVLIDFHVPHPPLQFQDAYVALTATSYAAKGFKVTDDAGTPTIASVEIVGDACVLLTLGRELSTGPYVSYGDFTTHAGNGNLCDSDPTVASADYEYTAGTGQYAGAEIAALEDEPYPLWNWCVLFRMAIESDPPSA